MTSEHPEMSRPALTLSAAAAACGVSRSTIRRRRESGDFPSAFRDETGSWHVPIEDLLACGFRLTHQGEGLSSSSRPGGEHGQGHTSEQAPKQGGQAPEQALTDALVAAEARATIAEARAESLERVLAERAQVVEALQVALRAIEARPQAVVDVRDPVTVQSARLESESAERRGWWRRRRDAR
jgi:hypothetical protein